MLLQVVCFVLSFLEHHMNPFTVDPSLSYFSACRVNPVVRMSFVRGMLSFKVESVSVWLHFRRTLTASLLSLGCLSPFPTLGEPDFITFLRPSIFLTQNIDNRSRSTYTYQLYSAPLVLEEKKFPLSHRLCCWVHPCYLLVVFQLLCTLRYSIVEHWMELCSLPSLCVSFSPLLLL